MPWSNEMMNNSTSLPSIYSHQKLEPLLCCNNRRRCLRWTPPLFYIFQSGTGPACSLITPTDKMRRDLWPWPRLLIASASAVPLSGNEAHSRNPIRSTQSALKLSSQSWLFTDWYSCTEPDIFSVPSRMNQHLSSYYPLCLHLALLRRRSPPTLIVYLIWTIQSRLSSCLQPRRIGKMAQSYAF